MFIFVVSILLLGAVYLIFKAKKKIAQLASLVSTLIFAFMLIGKIMPFYTVADSKATYYIYEITNDLKQDQNPKAREIMDLIKTALEDQKIMLSELNQISKEYNNYLSIKRSGQQGS